MKSRYYLTHCRLVLPDSTVDDGSVLIEDQFIRAICPNQRPSGAVEFDLQGDTLMPGMIDLHSDAIESFAEPRTGIYLPFEMAAAYADRVAMMCGITTFYNSISFAGEELGLRAADAPNRLVEAVANYRQHAFVDQRIHCRFEITYVESLPSIIQFIEDGICDFVSYMDHSPGQGQFTDEANYRDYMTTRYGYDAEAVTKILKGKEVDRRRVNECVEMLASAARSKSIPLAGHDADSEEHVLEMKRLGAVLAEFPMHVHAAEAAVRLGLHQSVGAVNVIRGGSQRTGMSALKLIENYQADCLCSDYVPSALLPAVFKIAHDLQRPLHDIVRLVTAVPADVAGLPDRGRIAVDTRADLVSVSLDRPLPFVRATWFAGRPVYVADASQILAAVDTSSCLA